MATSRLKKKIQRDGVSSSLRFDENFVKAYDERGRRRFHGAFTGGYSAGYFNTVGSKEGWAPSTFRSSRNQRANASEQRAEDFMDEEDLAEIKRESKLSTTDAFSSQDTHDPFAELINDPAANLVQASSSQMGQTLLRHMGWKPGQGIGPLVTFEQRENLLALLESLHLASPRQSITEHHEAARHRYPPPATKLVQQAGNRDKHGLGMARPSSALQDTLQRFHQDHAGKVVNLSSMDSDDEDHIYSAPQDIHQSTLGSHRESFRLGNEAAPAAQAPLETAKWNDGRPIPAGFVPSDEMSSPAQWFDPPKVPKDWTPDPRRVWTQFLLTKPSNQPTNPAERAKLLGEARLPGPPPKITTYLGEQAAKRIEALATYQPDSSEKALEIPSLEPSTAARALEAFVAVGPDSDKHARYKSYLEAFANQQTYIPPEGVEHLQEELNEFNEAAQRYRPTQGSMASRFTSSTVLKADMPGEGGFLSAEAAQPKFEEPIESQVPKTLAQQAARAGEFGYRTRSMEFWNPPRLLCKRLGCEPPHGDLSDDPMKQVREKFGGQSETASTESGDTQLPSESEYVFAPINDATERATEAALREERPSMDLFKAVFESDNDDHGDEEDAIHENKIPTLLKRKQHNTNPKRKTKGHRVGPLTFDLDDE
ncbi:hypothetical protein MYAM1_003050 [Malassezia yamatoensis]|uniref:G-patch domain-containing protein n=1 Tax=Malassezia yamatoensis TaxID=253288 RepID=A0AAJ6CK32_9BASI|nr:hypothetical protein MYAM1_003050 [Malassezia yamatoensis]